MTKKIYTISRGFTLVELLVVMVVFSLVGAITGAILVNSLRTSNKANSLTVLKQNGDYVIEQTEKLLREARVLKSPFPCGLPSQPTQQASIALVNSDGLEIDLACMGNTIASNGASLLDTTAVVIPPGSCTFTCSQQSNSDFPIISLQFSLISNTSSPFSEQTASASAIPFFTSVVMRNMNR